MATRITELPNELSDCLDAVGSLGIARIIRQVDQQLFTGWRQHPCLYDSEISSPTVTLLKIKQGLQILSKEAEELLLENIIKGDKHTFVFSGCGTSGRIAWLCARSYNRLLSIHHPELQHCFKYCISGGDESLVISNELPEDDPRQGEEDLKARCRGCDRVMYFGITCGLSAPYVAGQINYAMHEGSYTTSLIGFNPIELARDAPIEEWNLTCRDVFKKLESLALHSSHENQRHFILNPIIGPEALTGSSRMKGGNATKIILDAIFLPAIKAIISKVATRPTDLHLSTPIEVIAVFERVFRQTHYSTTALSHVADMAGKILAREDSKLCYIGLDTSGLIGLKHSTVYYSDASEMVDTYGCREDQVRTFMAGGWATCENIEGDMSHKNAINFQISLHSFITTSSDSDDFESEDGVIQAVIKGLVSSKVQLAAVHVSATSQPPIHFSKLNERKYIPCQLVCDVLDISNENFFAFFALKLALNVVTTGANVLRGAVYSNKMINLTVSNNKLFTRSATIVAELAQCSIQNAEDAILKATYGVDTLSENLRVIPLSQHIKAATPQPCIVPKAVLIARGCSVERTKQLLMEGTPLRSLIVEAASLS
eukprot:gene7280-9711_t